MFIQGDTGKLIHNGDFTKIKKIEQFLLELIKEDEEKKVDELEEVENKSKVIMDALMGHGNKRKYDLSILKKHFGLFRKSLMYVPYNLHCIICLKTRQNYIHSYVMFQTTQNKENIYRYLL